MGPNFDKSQKSPSSTNNGIKPSQQTQYTRQVVQDAQPQVALNHILEPGQKRPKPQHPLRLHDLAARNLLLRISTSHSRSPLPNIDARLINHWILSIIKNEET